jgi:ATP-binding cassette subfamily B protein
MSVSNISVIGASPRYFVESLSIVVLVFIAYFLSKNNTLNDNAIPMLGMLGLGAQRLLPNIQQIYLSFTQIKSGNPALVDVLSFINEKSSKNISISKKPLKLSRNIALKNVYFRYASNSEWILKDINLTIKKGTCIGVVGSSGSGKSTLMDILLGLLLPSKGKVLVDDTSLNAVTIDSFQAAVAHVPQSIFLADVTIAENIAFGIALDDINMALVKIAAKKAQISEFIESLPNQYLTIAGEKGARMSGGQRQRIGFARALYKKADILVLDEITSSLDKKNEKSVMKTIENIKKDMTVLIVSHSHSILKVCDSIIELDHGNLKKYTYNQFVKLYKE